MSLCASCGLQLSGDARLCSHHHMGEDADWSATNRIMCDLLHRQRVPDRVPQEDRPIESEVAW